jgi:hypothetical protein
MDEFEIRNFGKPVGYNYKIAGNVVDATFNFSVYKDIYALIRFGNNIDLVKIVFNKKELERTTRLTFELTDDELMRTRMISIDELTERTKPSAVMLSFKKKSVLYYFWKNRNIRTEIRERLMKGFPVKYSKSGDRITFFAYSEEGNLWEMNPLLKSAKTIARIEQNEINDYFVATLQGRNKYLIYSYGKQNSITFKKHL